MERQQILKEVYNVIKENYKFANCGIFATRNTCNDCIETLYEKYNIRIDICYHYSCFEVFGLTEEEFTELENYYDVL